MTTTEYTAMMDKACKGLKYLSAGGLCAGCSVCQSEHDVGAGKEDDFADAISSQEILEEPWFSSGQCDICGTRLGGNRMSGHYVDDENNICHIDEICTDCVLYLANGDTPECDGNNNEITE